MEKKTIVMGVIGADVHAIDHHLVVDDPHKGLLDAAFAHAEGLHLCSCQGNAAFKFIVDEIVKIRLFIVGDQLDTILPHRCFPRFCLIFTPGRKPLAPESAFSLPKP